MAPEVPLQRYYHIWRAPQDRGEFEDAAVHTLQKELCLIYIQGSRMSILSMNST